MTAVLQPFTAPALDPSAVAAVDSTRQADDVLALPTHLREALRRVRAADIPPLDRSGGLVIAGMGGSAAGGRLALGALNPRLRAPLAISDGSALPGWVGPDTTVLCSSYSGTTVETLAAYDDAARRSASRLVATAGGTLARRARADGVPALTLPKGLQPRAAVAYALVYVLEVAAVTGVAPAMHEEIAAAAELADRLIDEWGPGSPEDSLAKAIARDIDGCVPVIAGAELAAAVAYRWKCQLNENASVPAFASAAPTTDRNEIVGWDAALGFERFAYISLEDPATPQANARRAELAAHLAAAGTHATIRVSARGDAPLERLVSLVLLGDLVSIYAAVLRGTDPVEIPAIDKLKPRTAG